MRPWTILLIAAVLVATLVGACATIDEIAPPVDEALLTTRTSSEESLEQIQLGREIYITKCARCHSPARISRYSLDRWDEILPRMAQKASLSPLDRTAVEEYVKAVLAMQRQ